MHRRSRLVVFHPMDPRGAKLGGIETHVRLILAHHPPDVAVLLVGVDEIGDLAAGEVAVLAFEGRKLDFLPVLRADSATINAAAARVTRSLTLRYTAAALRRLGALRRAVGDEAASCEIGRFEFAVLPAALRLPCVLTVHNEGRRGDAMDSLLKRWWWLHRLNERIALRAASRVFAVNDAIAARVVRLSPRLGGRTQVLSVSVDARRFRPSPFEAGGDCLRVCFAGRLDKFKQPALMFAALALAAERLAATPAGRFRRLSFRYAGASDPSAVAGYEELRGIVEHRGSLDAAATAALMRDSHLGIITSVFEGLPCYLLEMLASGRPVVASALPQFAGLIEDGVSGRLCRGAGASASPAALAEALVAVAAEIAGGRLDPDRIAAKVANRTVDAQMGRLFQAHREVSRPRSPASPRPSSLAG